MELKLGASMLKMYPRVASCIPGSSKGTSNIAYAVDQDSRDESFLASWLTCTCSQAIHAVPGILPTPIHWIAIDLKGVYLISRVSLAARFNYGKNSAVFVGNNPNPSTGRDDYQCGVRWTTKATLMFDSHNFPCQPPRWVSHISVQKTPEWSGAYYFYLEVCEVDAYYITSGMLLFYIFHRTQYRHCSNPYTLLSCVGAEMEVKLGASMLKMYPRVASCIPGSSKGTSNIAYAVDQDSRDESFLASWLTCTCSQAIHAVPGILPTPIHWIAIDLKGVYLISRVSLAARYNYGKNSAVFFGNNPNPSTGRDDYQCGVRWTTKATLMFDSHNFTCQPPRWVSHISVQKTPEWSGAFYFYLEVCEVDAYYITSGMLLFYIFHRTQYRHCSNPCLLFCHTGVSISLKSTSKSPPAIVLGEPILCATTLKLSSVAKRVLQLHWTYPNGIPIAHGCPGSVAEQYNVDSATLTFTNVDAPRGNYSCKYTLNGRNRSQIVSVAGEMDAAHVTCHLHIVARYCYSIRLWLVRMEYLQLWKGNEKATTQIYWNQHN